MIFDRYGTFFTESEALIGLTDPSFEGMSYTQDILSSMTTEELKTFLEVSERLYRMIGNTLMVRGSNRSLSLHEIRDVVRIAAETAP